MSGVDSINILYEDNHVIAVVKPPGILSQSDGSGAPDMVTLLKEDLKYRYKKPGNVYVGLVHRLDRNVGGTMLFAKTSKGASRLSESLRRKQFYKAYFAIAVGRIPETEMVLENCLLKDSRENKVYEDSAEGKPSVLRILRLAENTACGRTLVMALPITGRSHQIRAQMAMAGFPLEGDAKYGSGAFRRGRRQELGLWSCHAAVKHPVKETPLHVTSMPERQGIWKQFSFQDYRQGAEVPAERIIQWFTI